MQPVAANTVIKQYKILAPIGKGGMGEVYLAHDTALDRRVALKILPSEFADDSDPDGPVHPGGQVGVGVESSEHHHHLRDR
jgi:serine/threonine protein kinase